MKYLLILLVCGALSVRLSAQITISGAPDGVEMQQYNDTLLYVLKDVGGVGPFGAIAFVPGGSGGWRYEWRYEGNVQPVDYSGDSSSLTVAIPGSGFYYFRAEHDSVGFAPVERYFHLFFNHLLEISIDLADEEDCEMIRITVDEIHAPLYRGVFPGAENVVYTVVWGDAARELAPTTGYNYREIAQVVAGVTRDVTCRLRIKDRFGFEWESNAVEYTSVIPSAELNIDVVDPISDKTGEAPLEVNFGDAGENAQTWEWWLYKDTVDFKELYTEVVEDSLLEERIRYGESISYVYEHPGYYGVKLIATNTRGRNQCKDTTEVDHIIVYYSLVDVPNVFTPNGDGINDVFRVKTRSLESFHGIILNRWEQRVFEWRNPEEGWNGRINGKYASPGTYYYIIKAKGREKHAPPRYLKKGALLLVR